MPVKETALFLKIADELRHEIRSGVRKPGEMLASERDLARAFEVSRPSVRKALSLLEREGWVETKPGLGNFVKAYGTANTHRLSVVKSIALVIPHIANPFFSELTQGIERLVRQMGHQVVLTATGYQWEEEAAYLRSIAHDRRVDGVLIWPVIETNSPPSYRVLEAANIPYVLIARDMETVEADMVFADGYAGMSRATEYLIGLGHRSIAYIHALPQLKVDLRLNGYEATMRQHGLEVGPVIIGNAFATDGGYEAALEVLQQTPRPTAVLAQNDATAIGILKAARQLHLRVPEELSVIGFDNISISQHLAPPLTTLDGSTFMLAKLSLLLLMDRISGEAPQTKQVIKLVPKLVCRGSCASPGNMS
jgi:LacI family transcriptional regulator